MPGFGHHRWPGVACQRSSLGASPSEAATSQRSMLRVCHLIGPRTRIAGELERVWSLKHGIAPQGLFQAWMESISQQDCSSKAHGTTRWSPSVRLGTGGSISRMPDLSDFGEPPETPRLLGHGQRKPSHATKMGCCQVTRRGARLRHRQSIFFLLGFGRCWPYAPSRSIAAYVRKPEHNAANGPVTCARLGDDDCESSNATPSMGSASPRAIPLCFRSQDVLDRQVLSAHLVHHRTRVFAEATGLGRCKSLDPELQVGTAIASLSNHTHANLALSISSNSPS